MSMQDPISDMLTRIRNGQLANKLFVNMPSSKLKIAISSVLKEEGYIVNYMVEKNLKSTLKIFLKYFKGKSVIEKIQRISKPSLRIYKKKYDLPKVMGGLGIAIISTSKGVLTDKIAREKGLGGEVICHVT
ncbi:30S ribosomal protein S8 [Buchnera aphidicola (Mindarus keteleerifoliae)]|uniref:30S ribosomal protein S8 n=1 Tax=Buchnera aphidicola TaxID=9 RepID=UPI0031B6E25F